MRERESESERERGGRRVNYKSKHSSHKELMVQLDSDSGIHGSHIKQSPGDDVT